MDDHRDCEICLEERNLRIPYDLVVPGSQGQPIFLCEDCVKEIFLEVTREPLLDS